MELDLHVHTKYSFDSSMSPKKVVKTARSRGLNAIAITDHDSIEGALEAQQYQTSDFFVIVGEEIDTEAGDIIGLFLKEQIKMRDPAEAIRQIKAQGGIAVLPHPFSKTMAIEEHVARMLDACEGFNARHARGRKVEEGGAEPHIQEFATQYDLSLTAGSDAHFYPEIGQARTIVPATTLEEAKQAILRGDTVLAGHKHPQRHWLVDAVIRSTRRLINPVP